MSKNLKYTTPWRRKGLLELDVCVYASTRKGREKGEVWK